MDVNVTLSVRVRATASSSETATSELTHNDIAEALQNMGQGEMTDAITGHDVDDVEAA